MPPIDRRAGITDRLSSWPVWVVTRCIGVLILAGAIPYRMGSGWVLGDVHAYERWSGLLWSGHLPYRDFPVEYPPGILPMLALPHLSAPAFVAEFLLAALAVDALVLRTLSKTRPIGAALWVAFPLMLGPVVWARLDIFVAAALVGAVISFEQERFRRAGLLIAAAGLLKLWPFALLIVLLPLAPQPKRWRFALWSTATSVVVLGSTLAIVGRAGFLLPFKWHLQRGVQIESVVAVPFHVARLLGARITTGPAYGSWEVFGRYTSAAATVSAVLLVLAVVACGLAALRIATDPPPSAAAQLVAIVILATLVTSKVLSAQFMLAAIVAIAMCVDAHKVRATAMFWLGASLLSAQLVFPFLFFSLLAGEAVAVAAAVLHAASLIALLVYVARPVLAWARHRSNETRVEPPVARLITI